MSGISRKSESQFSVPRTVGFSESEMWGGERGERREKMIKYQAPHQTPQHADTNHI